MIIKMSNKKVFFKKTKERRSKHSFMNLEILFQLAAVLVILGAGPLVIVLLASRSGNL